MLVSRRLILSAAVALAATPAFAQPSSGDASREAQRLTSAESYLPMPTLQAGVIVNYTARGTLVVDVGLDIPNATLRARAQSLTPRLVDALRTSLSTYAGAYLRDRTAPDPNTVGRLMQTAVDRVLGASGARLLLANIIYQQRAN